MRVSPLRRLAWRAARAIGGRAARWAWDDQFRRGRWQFIADERSPTTVQLVARHARGGRVIELGCGEGGLAQLLPRGCFSSFHGIDISAVAIERARARTLAHCTFDAMALEDWPGDSNVECLVAEEVLYYLSPAARADVLKRCLASLAPEGVLLAIVHDSERYADVMEDVRLSGAVKFDVSEGSRSYVGVGALTSNC